MVKIIKYHEVDEAGRVLCEHTSGRLYTTQGAMAELYASGFLPLDDCWRDVNGTRAYIVEDER